MAGEVITAEPYGGAAALIIGALVQWGELLGVVQAVEAKRVTVRFDRGDTMTFNADSGVITRVGFQAGSQVRRISDGSIGVVLEEVSGQVYPTWKVAFPGAFANVAEVGVRPAIINDPLQRMRSGQLGTADAFNLRAVAADYWTAHRHNELVSLAYAHVDLKPHQVSVVHRVISKYPYRFMLCDEVGLGKTIEAAMIIKELRARGQARRVLILVPAGLARQWQFELKTKFNETFAIYNANTVRYLKDQKGIVNPWTDHDSIIASHTWASWKDARRKEIASVEWDMVIVDEAHHARLHRNGSTERRTQLFRLVQDLVARPEFARRAALLVTATPLQLERYELYSLTEMLDPILFASERDFVRHIESLSGLNRAVEHLEGWDASMDGELLDAAPDVARFLEVPEEEAARLLTERGAFEVAKMLRERHRLSEVLIRNRKSVVQGFQPRSAFRWEVDLSSEEKQIHELMDSIFEKGFRLAEETNQNAVGFLMVMLQKLLASSSRALLKSLRGRRDRLLAGLAKPLTPESAEEGLEDDVEASSVVAGLAPGVENEIGEIDQVIDLLAAVGRDSKAQVLFDQLARLLEEDAEPKVLVFTEFRETQEMLSALLAPRWAVHTFHGQLSPAEKDAAVDAFRTGRGPQILLSTEAGGEGRNFQFCHYLVNYDLPWNPMKVEQRIGRVDRIGQENPITIFNFHVRGTIEGRILDVLERRIKIFEEAVGGLDPILGEAENDIRKALRLAQKERDAAMDRLGRHLEQRVAAARDAEKKLNDFILQDKSYSAEIAQVAMQAKAPISYEEFETFLLKLLHAANAFLGPRQENGERRVVFHPPFAMEHPELLQGQEARRVCFDPRLRIESELVEYLGFGHPIVDALVKRVTEERQDGAAAVRRVSSTHLDRPGWQFNWRIAVGGLRPNEFIYSVFVDDMGLVDEEIGSRLLSLSRKFNPETSAGPPPLATLDAAYEAAQTAVGLRRDRELLQVQRNAQERADVEEQRLAALFEQRTRAAVDRIESCRRTLERVRQSEDALIRQAIVLWEANLVRAQAELDALKDDLERSRIELQKKRSPSAEFSLVGVARIHVEPALVASASLNEMNE